MVYLPIVIFQIPSGQVLILFQIQTINVFLSILVALIL